MGHIGSYVWEPRRKGGNRQLLLPGAQVLVLRTDGAALLQRRADGVWELPAHQLEYRTVTGSMPLRSASASQAGKER